MMYISHRRVTGTFHLCIQGIRTMYYASLKRWWRSIEFTASHPVRQKLHCRDNLECCLVCVVLLVYRELKGWTRLREMIQNWIQAKKALWKNRQVYALNKMQLFPQRPWSADSYRWWRRWRRRPNSRLHWQTSNMPATLLSPSLVDDHQIEGLVLWLTRLNIWKDDTNCPNVISFHTYTAIPFVPNVDVS